MSNNLTQRKLTEPEHLFAKAVKSLDPTKLDAIRSTPKPKDLEACVEEIAKLPDRVLSSLLGILLPTGPELELLEKYRTEYRYESLWLRHLVLSEELDSRCLKAPTCLRQPQAEMSNAYLILATAVHSRSGFFQALFDHPYELWYWCCYCECQLALTQSGLISSLQEGIPKADVMPKTNWRSFRPQIRKALWECKLTLSDVEETDWSNQMGSLLILEGQAIASKVKSSDKFYKNTWYHFCRVYKEVTQTIREGKYHASYLTPDGQIKVTTKHAKIGKSAVN